MPGIVQAHGHVFGRHAPVGGQYARQLEIGGAAAVLKLHGHWRGIDIDAGLAALQRIVAAKLPGHHGAVAVGEMDADGFGRGGDDVAFVAHIVETEDIARADGRKAAAADQGEGALMRAVVAQIVHAVAEVILAHVAAKLPRRAGVVEAQIDPLDVVFAHPQIPRFGPFGTRT